MSENLLKNFSKETNPEGRDKLSGEIREARRERFDSKKELEDKSGRHNEAIEAISSREKELATELERLNDSGLAKYIQFYKIHKHQKEIEEIRERLGQEKRDKKRVDGDIEELSMRDGFSPWEFKESKQKIESFYAQEKNRWSEMPYDEKEVKEHFNPERLSKMSLEDYVVLLQRFNANMVTHVTRQGVRDHVGMMAHSVGRGKAFNGFKEMMSDKKIKYNFELRVLEAEKKESIAEYLMLDTFGSKEEAIQSLNSRFFNEGNQMAAGSFVDFHGPHFAVEWVADCYYGAESGNEIFMTYPSYAIASNYFHRRDPHVSEVGSNYNDLWVYMQEHENLPTDAGIAFIREDAQVDPMTGSIYEINENGEGVEDIQTEQRLMEIVSQPGFDVFTKKAAEILGKIRPGSMSASDQENMDEIKSELTKEFGVKESELDFFMEYGFLASLKYSENEEDKKSAVNSRMIDQGIKFKKAKETISSKDYWEKYFAENPNEKPSKYVFYQGADPNRALDDWRAKNNLSRRPHKEIQDKRILDKEDKPLPDEIKEEMNRFKSLVHEVVDDYFE